MKLTLTPTAEIALIDGSPARKWEGTSEDGVAVHAYIRTVLALTDDPARLRQFDEALQALPQPGRLAFNIRFVV